MRFINNFKKVYRFSLGYRKYIVLYFFMSLFIGFLGVVTPILAAYELVNFTNGIWSKVVLCALLVFCVDVFSSIINFVLKFASQKFSKLVISKIQLEIGKEILKIKLVDIDKHSNGVFIQRLTSDAFSISSVFTFGVSIFTDIINNLGLIIAVFIINFGIGLYFFVF